MSSDNSAKPILVAGAVGTVVLLGLAWMFAASTSERAVVDAEKYAMSRAVSGTETAAPEAEAVASEETEPAAETEVAAAEEPATEEPAAEEPKAEEPVVETPAEVAAVEEQPEAEAEPAAEEPKEEAVAATEEEPKVEEPAATETAAAEPEAPAAEPEAPAVAPAPVETASLDGDPAKGAKVFRKCKACHKIGDNAKNAVGPHLTGVVGRAIGGVEGFKYSKAFMAVNAEGRVWSPAELDAFLLKPSKHIPKTKMAFVGLRKDADRANVIAYLATDGK